MMSFLHKVADGILKKIHRSPLYYKRYNTTLEYKVIRRYLQYGKECAATYANKHHTHFPPSLLHTQPAVAHTAALAPEKAKALSAKMTELIDRNDTHVWRNPNPTIKSKQIVIQDPLVSMGESFLECLDDPKLNATLQTFFGGHYAVASIFALRSLVAGGAVGSWLWHSDCYPPYTCKLFLHLTKADADTGATEFMSREDTMAYRDAGYFGQHGNERRGDLDVFAKEHGLPYKPFHIDAEPGDATVFNMNFFHRAVSPRTAFRDVIELFFVPSTIPWREHLEADRDFLRDPGRGFPKNPAIMRREDAPAPAMM